MLYTNRGKFLEHNWIYRNVTKPANFYVALVTSAAAPTVDTNTLSELTEVAAGNGYTSGGIQLTPGATDFDSIAENDTDDRSETTLRDLVWTASGGSLPGSGSGARYAVLTTDEATIGNRQVIAAWDLSSDRTVSDGQTLTLSLELRATEPA